jgi:hypothetical protein
MNCSGQAAGARTVKIPWNANSYMDFAVVLAYSKKEKQ